MCNFYNVNYEINTRKKLLIATYSFLMDTDLMRHALCANEISILGINTVKPRLYAPRLIHETA